MQGFCVPTSAQLTTIDSVPHRGFTAEEVLDNLKFVDLNGRVYSPFGSLQELDFSRSLPVISSFLGMHLRRSECVLLVREGVCRAYLNPVTGRGGLCFRGS